MVGDIQYAVRLLAKHPVVTLLTTLIITGGFSLSVYLFSFVHAALFRSLPFQDGASLVKVFIRQDGVYQSGWRFTDYQNIKQSIDGLEGVSAYKEIIGNAVMSDGGAKHLRGVQVEPNFFALTHIEPVLGQLFTGSFTDHKNLVLIGFDIWQQQFGGDAGILERHMRINGVDYRIAGIMPQNYFFPGNAEFWLPISPLDEKDQKFNILAHVKNGYLLDDINKQLTHLLLSHATGTPFANKDIAVSVGPMQLEIAKGETNVIPALQTAAAIVLLLAALNMGNVLMLRAAERGRETAVRMALGAPRTRLIRQMMWESILICSLGAGISFLIVAWGLGYTERYAGYFLGERPPFWWHFYIDRYAVQLFAMFFLLVILVAGFFPAFKNSAANVNSVLRSGTRGALSRQVSRFNYVLIATQIFLFMTLLIAAGVTTLAAYKSCFSDYGVEADNKLIANVALLGASYDLPLQKLQFFHELQARLENTADVGNVAIMSVLPGNNSEKVDFEIEAGPSFTPASPFTANYIAVMPGALSVLDIDLRSGRYFNKDDVSDVDSVIVTESFVERYLSTSQPIGKRIRVNNNGVKTDWLTIVGVVEHAIYGPADEDVLREPSFFVPYLSFPRQQMGIAMQIKSDVSSVTQYLQNVLRSIDPNISAFKIRRYTELFFGNAGLMKFICTVFIFFGVASLVLPACGTYCLMTQIVYQKTQEIGLRRAMGASDREIILQLLKASARYLAWGGGLGFLGGIGMSLAMAQIMPTTLTEFLLIASAAILFVGLVIAGAIFFPARRVLLLEPAMALRHE